MRSKTSIFDYILGVAGAIVGAVLAYFAFFFLTANGLYALALPGAMVGTGCGFFSGMRSNVLGGLCFCLALFLGCYLEWRFAPFIADDGFPYFLAHVHQLKPITQGMIVLGGVFGFWFGRGRDGGVWLRRR